MPISPARAFVMIAATAAVSAVPAPTPAQAGGFGCTASTLRATVLGTVVEPVTAGTPDACVTAERVLDVLDAPLAADSAVARTGVTGDRATATTSLTGFRAGALDALLSDLPQIALPAGIGALPVALPASAALLGLPSSITVDATDAAQALVTRRELPAASLVAADLVELGAAAACDAGRTVLDSLARVVALTALGQSLPTDRPIDTAVPLVPAQVVDFSALDVDAINLPAGLSLGNPLSGAVLRVALESAVSSLPTVSVPAALGRVQVEPARQERSGDALRQLGPRVRVEALGREVADVTLGDALVSALGITCTAPVMAPPAAPVAAPVNPATALALSCAGSDIALTDVVEKDGRVKLVGVANARYVGRTVNLILSSTGEQVASAVVGGDGYFRARAALPREAIRFTNLARYQAVIDDQRSKALKLHRRMRISRMKPGSDTITITGRIYGRMSGDKVLISRREACVLDVELTQVTPDADGRWRVTLPLPAGVDATTYRATTTVRKGDNPKRFRTFSLPGHVAL